MSNNAFLLNPSKISGDAGVYLNHRVSYPVLQVSIRRHSSCFYRILGLVAFFINMNLAMAQTTPDAPTQLTARAGINRVLATFLSPANNGGAALTNYQYSTDNGTTWTAVSPVSTLNSIIITGLNNCTSYDIKVRAVNSMGAGTSSTAVAAKPRTGTPHHSWIIRSSAADNIWSSVTYGNGLFVAVANTGTGNRVMTSPDGITWTIRSSAANNSWNSVTYGNGLFVAVANSGSGNRVMTSLDGITWTIRSSAANNSWSSVTYGNGLFVAVAGSGTGNRVMTSPDGTAWTIRSSAADNSWSSVTYGNGLFVAVAGTGTGDRVMTSPDGITWTIRSSAADISWKSATYGNSVFVAVASSGTGNRVMTSPDGTTWNIRSSAADNNWNSVTYGNGLFVAVAGSGTGDRVMTSPDGINWTSPRSAADNSWSSVTYGNGLFAAVANSGTGNRVMTSFDALVPDLPVISSITPSGDYVSIALTAPSEAGESVITNYQYSTDGGSNWVTRSPTSVFSPLIVTGLTQATTYHAQLRAANRQGAGCASATVNTTTITSSAPNAPLVPTPTPGIGRVIVDVTKPSDGGSFISNYQYSTDGGGSWTAVSPASTSTRILITGLTNCSSYNIRVRALNGVGAGVASMSVAAMPRSGQGSGTNWTIRNSAADNNWLSVTYGNGLFVAVASSGTGNRVMTSPDGVNWAIQNSAADNEWNSVTYGNGLFVAVAITGTGNRVMTSPDGFNWTIRNSAADLGWNSVTYGNGLFVAVAFNGTMDKGVMTSPDGINWTIRNSAAGNYWNSVTYGSGLFVAVAASGAGNRVMTSPDGVNWTIRNSAADNSWVSVTYGNGLFVAMAVTGTGNRVMTSPDGTNWTIQNSAADNYWGSVTYGSGLFVAVAASGAGNRVMTSPDGITWTIRSYPVDNGWIGITYGNGQFVAVAYTGTGNRVMTSFDALIPEPPVISSITPATTNMDVAFAAPVDAGGSFISNYEYSSDGGINWITRSPASITSPLPITGLTHATAYQGQLRAVNAQGSGCASATVNTTTMSSLTWDGSAGTDWNTTANWTPEFIPVTGSSITIPSGLSNYPILPSAVTMTALTMTAVNYVLGSSIVTLTGSLTNNGTISGAGSLKMAGSSAQTISGTGSVSNLEINNAAGVTITSGAGHMLTITGKLTPTSGTLTTNGNLTLRSSATGTARVGAGSAAGGYVSGNVITQRYLSKLTGTGRNGRAWRLVTIPVTGTGTLRDVFMAGQLGADLTVAANRSAQPNDLGTVVIGHNQPNASAATGAGYDWIGTAGQVSSLRYYQQNATNGSFASSQVPLLTTTYTSAAQGYMLFARGDRQQDYSIPGQSSATILQATGALKQGQINVTIPALASAGFVLVGNPYMALLDLEKVILDNSTVIDNTVYVWDANIDGNAFKQGGYRAVTRTGVNSWTASGAGANPQYIESGSAFFVKPSSSGGTLSIKEAHKVDGTPGIAPHATMTDGPSRLFINLEVTDTANRRLVDGAVAFFDANYNDALGDVVDIEPMTNLTAGSITLRQSGKKLSMEGRPWPSDSASRTLPVDMRNLGDDAYVLRILPTNMHKEGFTAWLRDRHLNKETVLKTEEETLYPFRRTGDLGIDSSRFEIVYRLSKPTNAGTLTPDNAAGEIGPRLYPNPAKGTDVKLSLDSLTPGRYDVQVLDMSGRLMLKRSIEHASANAGHPILQGQKLAPGQYLIRISSSDRPLHILEFILN